jgi:hypothetical protein
MKYNLSYDEGILLKDKSLEDIDQYLKANYQFYSLNLQNFLKGKTLRFSIIMSYPDDPFQEYEEFCIEESE